MRLMAHGNPCPLTPERDWIAVAVAYWGMHNMADILQTTFSNVFYWMLWFVIANNFIKGLQVFPFLVATDSSLTNSAPGWL